jgi:large-conductance mechanosensitive channel
MYSEFRQFLLKANVLALALAFILGVALAAVVNSLV